jgi:chaperonin GroEL
MAKSIVYAGEARTRVMRGIDLLADTVAITLGPRGRNVVMEHRASGLPPVSTRDGATVTQALNFSDRLENLGISLIRNMLSGVTKDAGDGTSTCVVLARRIAGEAARGMGMGLDPGEMRRGVNEAAALAIQELQKRAKRFDAKEMMAPLATIASHGDEDIGRLLGQVMQEVPDGESILVEPGAGVGDEIEIIQGACWEKGYLSPYFMTDKLRKVAELEQPLILLYDRPINEFKELLPVLEIAKRESRPLLIVAASVAEAALPGILLNHIRRTLQAVAVCAPGHGDPQAELLRDLATVTGGRCLLQASGDQLSSVTLADLGQARQAIIHEDKTVILGGKGDPAVLAELCSSVRAARANVLFDPKPQSPGAYRHELEGLEERLRLLSGSFAVIRVGGRSDAVLKERMQCFTNARNTIMSALAEGVVPGGGSTLFRIAGALSRLDDGTPAHRFGVSIVRRALEEPLRRIAEGVGLNPFEIMHEVRSTPDENFGLDATSGRLCNLVEKGVLDSVKVLRLGLQGAVSTASMLLMTECVVTEIPPQDPLFGYTAEWRQATREDPRV